MAKGIHRASKLAAKVIDSSPVSNATVLSTAAASGTVSAASPVFSVAFSVAVSVVSAHSGSAYHRWYYEEW